MSPGWPFSVKPVSAASPLRDSPGETLSSTLRDWSIPRQLAGEDPFGSAAESQASRRLRPRLEKADKIGTSICPYCAVGCAQLLYARGNDIINIEGDPRSPVNQGTLCPKGAATFGLINNPNRLTLEIQPRGTSWAPADIWPQAQVR
ncbi:MAG: hypothetical protein ACP5SH_03670 [Syntrophobacteraceae bacterium]